MTADPTAHARALREARRQFAVKVAAATDRANLYNERRLAAQERAQAAVQAERAIEQVCHSFIFEPHIFY